MPESRGRQDHAGTHLAIAAEQTGHTAAIIDIDRQSSAANWDDRRASDTSAVVPATAARFEQILAAARDYGATLAIIDTAPHSSSDGLKADQPADAILILTRPNILDLMAMKNSVQIAQLANQSKKKRTAVILDAYPPQGKGVIEDVRALKPFPWCLYSLPDSPPEPHSACGLRILRGPARLVARVAHRPYQRRLG